MGKNDYRSNRKDPQIDYSDRESEPINLVEETRETKPVTEGVVTNCMRLRVREKPDRNAAMICAIETLTKVVIDEDESTDEWYKVYLENGISGYCMKKFITVEQQEM